MKHTHILLLAATLLGLVPFAAAQGNTPESAQALVSAIHRLQARSGGDSSTRLYRKRLLSLLPAIAERGDANLTLPETKGNTALHYACAMGDEELVRLLLQLGADTTSRTDKGMTPEQCIGKDPGGRIRTLLQQNTSSPATFDAAGILGKLKASKSMYTESCQCDPDPAVASETLEREFKLCASGRKKLSAYSGCLVDLLEGYPARFGAEQGATANETLEEVLCSLMQAGAPVNGYGYRMVNASASCHGVLITPLHCVADMGDLNLARLLLESGANPRAGTRIGGGMCDDECTAPDKDKTPLDYARTPEIKKLIQQYIDTESSTGNG